MAGGVRHRAMRSVPEETQRCQRSLDCVGARHERTLDCNWIAGEGKAHTGNARRNVRAGGVIRDQAIFGVGFTPEIPERIALQLRQHVAVAATRALSIDSLLFHRAGTSAVTSTTA